MRLETKFEGEIIGAVTLWIENFQHDAVIVNELFMQIYIFVFSVSVTLK